MVRQDTWPGGLCTFFACACWLLIAACEGGAASDDEAPSEVLLDLVQNLDWTAIDDPAQDPFASMGRPDTVVCEEQVGWGPVLQGGAPGLDVDLEECNWLAVEQPLLQDVAAGERLLVGMYHYDLYAPEAAQAYLALTIGGETIWEHEIEIPGNGETRPADTLEFEFTAARDFAAGEQVAFHVHNHGDNSYVLSWLRVRRAD